MAATYPIGGERVVDAAIAALSADLTAALAYVAALTTDGLALPAPFEIVAGIRRTTPAYPVVEVAIADEDAGGPSIAWTSSELDAVLLVAVHVEDAASPERVYRRMLRYAAAVTKVLVVPGVLGSGVAVDRVRRSYRVDPETREVQERVGVAAIALGLKWVDAYNG